MGIQRVLKKFLMKEKTIIQKRNRILANSQFEARKLCLDNYPVKIFIDPCNYCNLNCVLCPVGTKSQGRKQTMMSFSTFKKVMDECGPYLWEVNLYNWGEPLLNKNIFKMIRYARKMKVDVIVSTNLNHFNEDICIQLVESGLNKLIVSLDGASQESVEKYQKGSNFEFVINSMKQIMEMKQRLKCDLPLVQWRYLVNKYNEDEIDKAKELSKKIKIDKFRTGGFDCDMGHNILLNNKEKYENIRFWLPKNEELSLYDYSLERKKETMTVCKSLWLHSVIQPDGAVSPCCAIWLDQFDFGNIHDSSFREIWNNQLYQEARRISREDNFSRSQHVCSICKRNDAIS